MMYRYIVMLFFAFFAASVCASGASAPLRVGEISALTGEVLIRAGGEWKKLDKAPHPLHSSDEIVTRRGRAEAKLDEAGTVLIDLDSHVSFVRDASGRQSVNVLLGDIWFDISNREGESVKFRSPSMTARVKVVSGMLRVSPEGATYHRITGGHMSLSGVSRLVPGAANLRPPDVRAVVLPESDPKIGGFKLQTAAADAVSGGLKATAAARRAEKEKSFARTAGEAVRVIGTETVKRQAAYSFASASVAEAERAVVNALAQIMKIRESLLEAEILGDSVARERIGGLLRQAEEARSDVKIRAAGVVKEASRVKALADGEALRSEVRPCRASKVDRALMMASALWVKASAASVGAEHIGRLGGVAVSLAADDEELYGFMSEDAAKTEQLASTAGIAGENASAAAGECNVEAIREAASVSAAIVAETATLSETAEPLETLLLAAREPEKDEAAWETPEEAVMETSPLFEEKAPSIEVLLPPPDSRELPSSSPSS